MCLKIFVALFTYSKKVVPSYVSCNTHIAVEFPLELVEDAPRFTPLLLYIVVDHVEENVFVRDDDMDETL